MPVAMTAGGQVYYLAYDQVGSLRVVTDSAGNIVKRIDYDSFGNILADSNPNFTVPFGFAGGLHDRDTGLVRFGARDYDPATGKWTAKDPIDFAGGDLNLQNYCLGDPVNWVDVDGLDAMQNILTQGYIGLVQGAVFGGFGGAAIAGVGIPGGILVGGIVGFSGGLLRGMILEIAGLNDPIHDFINDKFFPTAGDHWLIDPTLELYDESPLDELGDSKPDLQMCRPSASDQTNLWQE